ncbi:hypothetical protein DYB32_000072 [Aphanomyces invadans]|uniref:DUF4833 domain-containing protein n=1 Tax=Aphanomyces invadans TaxID=157072 RepID=A0A3R6ZXV6_9STRA|nr:hypothetical protein DYB32_000072 [Aphanomyces invadans]
MSWIWGSDATAEQANMVVMSLQGELDERQATIEALVKALKREKEEYKQALIDEVHDLHERKKALTDELAQIDALISAKTQQITLGNKPKSKGRATVAVSPAATEAAPTVPPAPAQPTAVKQPKKKTTAIMHPEAEASVAPSSIRVASTHPELQKVREIDAQTAFIIQRSNVIVYKGNLASNNVALDPKAPLHIYWIMFALPGNPVPTEELNMIERNTAYGATATPSETTAGEYGVALASLKDRRIVIFVDSNGQVRARSTVNGKANVYLERVYVQSTTSWGLPKVEYVEIFGVDPVTQERVYEKKLP